MKLKGVEKTPLLGPEYLPSHLWMVVPQKKVWVCCVLTQKTNIEQKTQVEGNNKNSLQLPLGRVGERKGGKEGKGMEK